MEDTCDSLAAIESRHKKEKKELQAQIQALKKAAKNDKSKKKELSTEIAKLETELDIRHKQELEVIDTSEPVNETLDSLESGVSKIKMSKAQKKRFKKTQQEKEREEQIKLQEKENILGPRHRELQALTARLKESTLKIFVIPSDGDCLYKAVAHQLALQRQMSLSVDELRKHVSTYMKQNKDDFIPFMSHPDTCHMLTDEEFNEYCEKIINTKVWGGQLEIRALSNSLKCPIYVIQATGPSSIEQGKEFEGPPLIITYHRHMYSLGEHYNSTCPSEDGEQE